MKSEPLSRRSALGVLVGVPLLAALAGADDKIDLTGTWTWNWKDGEGNTHRHVLEVEQVGGKLSARERFDNEKPVSVNDLKVVGKKVNFSVLRGDRRAAYEGSLADPDTINGTVTVTGEGEDTDEFGWTAMRQASNGKKKPKI